METLKVAVPAPPTAIPDASGVYVPLETRVDGTARTLLQLQNRPNIVLVLTAADVIAPVPIKLGVPSLNPKVTTHTRSELGADFNQLER